MGTAPMKILARATAAILSLTAMGCTSRAGDPPPLLSIGGDAPSALVVEASQPRQALTAIGDLIAGSAVPDEHLAVMGGTASRRVLAASLSPASPTMTGPVRPAKPGPGATQFQWDTYRNRLSAYQVAAVRDQRGLERLRSARLYAWAAGIRKTLAIAAAAAGTASGRDVDLSAATGYFGSLQQAGGNLGTRRVIVIVATALLTDEGLWARPDSLSGVTVIVAGFQGDSTEQVELQAALLGAGAARAVVLVPAATGELASVARQALEGQRGPAPVDLRFAAATSSLLPVTRQQLARLAGELTTVYPEVQVSILGFGDPRGNPVQQDRLSQQRAMVVQDFLESHGVAAFRLFAAGYGTDLADPRGNANRALAVTQQVVVVLNTAE